MKSIENEQFINIIGNKSDVISLTLSHAWWIKSDLLSAKNWLIRFASFRTYKLDKKLDAKFK